MNFTKCLLLLSVILFTFSCKRENNLTINSQDRLPNSVGKINSLYVFSDRFFDDNPVKESLFYHLNQPYLIVPRMSPAVDIKEFNYESLESGSSPTANNLIVVNLSQNSPIANSIKTFISEKEIEEALMGKQMALVRLENFNAKPQQVFVLFSNGAVQNDSELFQKQLQDYANFMIQETTQLDNQRVLSTFSNRRNKSMERHVAEKFGVSMWIPNTYNVIIEDENFLWILRETNDLYSGFVFYKKPNNNQPLDPQVLEIRDELGKYITTDEPNTRMTTHTTSNPYPIQRETQIGNNRVVETRGLWEIDNDNLGGGFLNYTFLNKENEIVSVDGFEYYAQDNERRQMRDIDALMSSIEVIE